MNITSKYITEMDGDSELLAAAPNFSNICNSSKTVLGMSATDITDLQTAVTNFTTQYNAWIAARAALKNTYDQKRLAKAALKASVNRWAKAFRANPAVPAPLLAQLLVAPHAPTRSTQVAHQPMNFHGTSTYLGAISLRWNRNGNKPGTQFLVEYRLTPTGSWLTAGTTLKSKFTYQSQPGKFIEFRVKAVRSGTISAPSAPYSFWEFQATQTLAVAA
ncbi:MAG: fibronectin type III domain-containing protein [Fimbriimonadaceae bacterium]